jgi:AraC-like DNA-binding protein
MLIVNTESPVSLIDEEKGRTREDSQSIYDFVRADALHLFAGLVSDLGGDPEQQLKRASIDPQILTKEDGIFSYRALIHLLQDCSVELDCPTFGLQLAARQGGLRVLGPLEIAMMNSKTFVEAYKYCAEHLQSYSPAVELKLGPPHKGGNRFIRFDILLDQTQLKQQAIEHALALMHHSFIAMSGREIRVREIWFAHERISPLSSYQSYFGTKVSFGKQVNAIFLSSDDFDRPIKKHDKRLYELATSYIETRFPPVSTPVSFQVRGIGARLLSEGQCSHKEVAEKLGVHPRTLQRRLREEGMTFEEIKDNLRREVALRYLGQKSISFTRLSVMLGYSEPSVLTRSCYRWFSASPRDIRRNLSALHEEPQHTQN